MRVAVLLPLCVCLCGCAAMIDASGNELNRLGTREEVRAELGEPVASGNEGAESYEEFQMHWKGSTRYITFSFGPGYEMVVISTLGAIDLITAPHEFYLACRRSLLGQTIRVNYNLRSEVTAVLLDGESVSHLGVFARRSRVPANSAALPDDRASE